MASLYDRISKGTMTIDEITESIKAATSEGGKFYQSMEKQSQTLSGQLATLQDNWNELLGSVTSGMSSEASNEMLPLVNNMIAELQSAFDRGGYDGLINAATDMIPDLLGMLTGKLEDAVSGLMRWLPQGIDAIMGAAPSAIKSASSALPQITNALFSVASVVISDLIGMLPELIPVVLEGVANMVGSVVSGIPQIFDSIGDGIEKAIHTGQQKVAGMWVDTDIVAKYDFDVEVGADEAVGEVEQAYTDIRDALSTDLLTDEQRAAIIKMIGEDESAIKAKLMEFGLSKTEAAQIATEVSTGSATITAALEGLDVGVDRKTIAKWMIQANTSNTKLIHFCREAGLSDSDIDEIVGVFNTANGRLSSETPSFAETIYKTLTDGLTDDEKTIAGLKEDVQTWSETALGEAEAGYNAAVAELDPDAPDYKQRLADLNAEYEATKTEIQSIRDSSYVIIDNLAGQSTQSVENAYQTIADIETRVNALEERIDVLRGKTTDQAEQAFKVVTAGGKADEDTINLAVAFKFNEFQLDKQAAEDAYNDAVNELNQALANNEITVDAYNSGMENAEAAKQAAIDAATQEYQKAFGEILMGISESEGYGTALEESAKKQAAWSLLQAFKAAFEDEDNGKTFEQYGSIVQQRLVDALNTILGGDIEHVETMDTGRMLYLIDDIFGNSLEDYTGDSLSPKAAAVLAQALNDGATLVGTSFDTSDTNQQLLALLASCFDDPNGTVSLEARAVVKSATDAMSDAEGAEAAGDETINGLRTSLVGGVNMAYTIGKNTGYAYARGYREAADIRSPSRVMRKLGDQTGKGLEIGLTESMKSAVSTAERLMGGLTTSADLSRITRVNMPELRQEITLAAEASATPVNLDGHQIAKIQGQNNASQLSWLRARSARGYGQK